MPPSALTALSPAWPLPGGRSDGYPGPPTGGQCSTSCLSQAFGRQWAVTTGFVSYRAPYPAEPMHASWEGLRSGSKSGPRNPRLCNEPQSSSEVLNHNTHRGPRLPFFSLMHATKKREEQNESHCPYRNSGQAGSTAPPALQLCNTCGMEPQHHPVRPALSQQASVMDGCCTMTTLP